MKFTVCVLLYGDNLELAKRCLGSIQAYLVPTPEFQLRIGLNAVCDATLQYVQQTFPDALLFYHHDNIHKYPIMREMIHGDHPVQTPYVMWFDDDSFLHGEMNLIRVENQLIENSADMLGSVYSIPWQGNQREFVKAQPWYNGSEPSQRASARFATGGWWVIQTKVLRHFDYPWTYLDHNGGDVMLGELIYQQGLRLLSWKGTAKINADRYGNESKAQRRGFASRPIGFDFTPGIGDTLNRVTPPPEPPVQQPAPAPVVPRLRRILDL